MEVPRIDTDRVVALTFVQRPKKAVIFVVNKTSNSATSKHYQRT
jgi:hypothetical protein